ncbi:MAG: GlcNAc-PI de-N-acetylase [Chloroflexi bacterium]|nr:GlcNAc-PI de-N-acetylase [Chloroflexota bacterium]
MNKRLLTILAHPDDESFGPGGTFARYADEGVDVHITIATDGAAGSVVEEYENQREQLAAVRAEEVKTAVNILGATLHTLDYRDSGYINDPANNHPDAFIQADDYEAVGKVVRLIREIRPQIIITHDETGGYFHPDHIHCWHITMLAWKAAADATQYPELGLEPYQPQRLYFTAFPNRWVRFFVFLARLRRQDPTKMGRNKDIDMTQLGVDPKKIHARIDYKKYWDVKRAASACHASQGGGTGGSRRMPLWLAKRLLSTDGFIRAYPETPDGYKEKDLFTGVEIDIKVTTPAYTNLNE